MGDLPYSASFYSQRKAKAVKDNAKLATRVAQERLFVALNPDQVQALTPELRIRLQLEATSGAYSRYSSILNWLEGPRCELFILLSLAVGMSKAQPAIFCIASAVF